MAVSRGEEHRQSHLFCGDCIPGPLIPSTDAKALLLAFRTDEVETAVGFQLELHFLSISHPNWRGDGKSQKKKAPIIPACELPLALAL
ncbi:hypothetical protein EGR_09884 [Echinococcus granulosus]|uniref:Uncharacterized protein n=1 Tax=Echinococcus granulosus TaxID=6210 RepID=W6U3T7_ECHGR|nr:hypothetical protein EGR_09884 [Echinococcus granulosus]EUB55251.1 hypothetical protein EGR_09884 [Echinococcus granulosus]